MRRAGRSRSTISASQGIGSVAGRPRRRWRERGRNGRRVGCRFSLAFGLVRLRLSIRILRLVLSWVGEAEGKRDGEMDPSRAGGVERGPLILSKARERWRHRDTGREKGTSRYNEGSRRQKREREKETGKRSPRPNSTRARSFRSAYGCWPRSSSARRA